MKCLVLFSCLLLVFGYAKAAPYNDYQLHGRPFNNMYRCYSLVMLPGDDRQDAEKADRIIMPPSALDQLTRLNIVYPMLFKLTNNAEIRSTHVGVLEFIADEGKIYIPSWMMRNLQLDEGDIVQIESVSLAAGTCVKFKAQSVDFLDISDHKAVLEEALRHFACLTTGDLIPIKHNSKIYEVYVLETSPDTAITILEVDLTVEFEAPVGYVEPTPVKAPEDDKVAEDNKDKHEDTTKKNPFAGEGVRVGGKGKKKGDKPEKEDKPDANQNRPHVRGIPDLNHPYGLIRFDRSVQPISDKTEPEPKDNDDGKKPKMNKDAFKGEGTRVRKNRKG